MVPSAPATLVAGGCAYGGPVNYSWLVVHEYRTYKDTIGNMVIQERVYPDDNNNINDLPATAPAWASGWTTAKNASGIAISSFNGVIYVNGSSVDLYGPTRTTSTDPNTAPPAVASFAKLNIVSSDDINLHTDIKYEKPLCYDSGSAKGYSTTDASGNVVTANCDDPKAVDANGKLLAKDNVLGLYTAGQDKNINIRTDLDYKDLTIHAVLMASNGMVRVNGAGPENNNVCPTGLSNGGNGLGNVRLLGGVIQNSYGIWGAFNNTTNKITCGYGRAVTYDRRMQDPRFTPPSFPTASSASQWSLKLFRTDQGVANQINPLDPTDPVNTPLPVIKGATQSGTTP
jgi:hypothetical protein